MAEPIYILVSETAWRKAQAGGAYRGGPDDARDGFLHFSTAAQLRASAAKHRAGEVGLLMVEVDPGRLGAELRWESASSGRPGLFPHLYGPLPIDAVASVTALPLDGQQRHVFPDRIP